MARRCGVDMARLGRAYLWHVITTTTRPIVGDISSLSHLKKIRLEDQIPESGVAIARNQESHLVFS